MSVVVSVYLFAGSSSLRSCSGNLLRPAHVPRAGGLDVSRSTDRGGGLYFVPALGTRVLQLLLHGPLRYETVSRPQVATQGLRHERMVPAYDDGSPEARHRVGVGDR